METPWTHNEELVANRIADLRATADRVRFTRHARKGSWLKSLRRRSSMAAGAPTTSGCVSITTAAC